MLSNKAIIFCGPSGAGKTTIAKYLLENNPRLRFSISACTRPVRKNESAGRDYYFLSKQEFKEKIANNEFIEWEEVYEGSYYGTLKSEIESIWAENKIAIFDVDVKGGLRLKNYFQHHALAIYVKVPHLNLLTKRLLKRNTDTEQSIKQRIAKAKYEASFENQFDATLLNDKMKVTLAKAQQLVDVFLQT
ncbi:MAG: guanylate kinase [Cytophagales bacterium]|nr:guanylate kinase [Cytophagales bacterium]